MVYILCFYKGVLLVFNLLQIVTSVAAVYKLLAGDDMKGLCEDEHCTERKKVNSMYKFSSDVLYGVYILSQHEP